MNVLQGFINSFNANFITESRYMLVLEGLGNTLMLSIIGITIGVIIGVVLTFMKLSAFKPLNYMANFYIDIIRGTPSVTQLLVIYFVVFGSLRINKIFIGGLAFGINSGAYVAEIIRAGILSIDKGQSEAGRSLGLSKWETMRYIVFPQAVKNILPALANEFIVLIKETAVAGYIAVMDLTKAATMIQSRTFSAAMPLLGSAVIYYVIIKSLSLLFASLEKKMRVADARN